MTYEFCVGKKYGKLTVVASLKEINPALYRFKCDCGAFTVLPAIVVERGTVTCCNACKAPA